MIVQSDKDPKNHGTVCTKKMNFIGLVSQYKSKVYDGLQQWSGVGRRGFWSKVKRQKAKNKNGSGSGEIQHG